MVFLDYNDLRKFMQIVFCERKNNLRFFHLVLAYFFSFAQAAAAAQAGASVIQIFVGRVRVNIFPIKPILVTLFCKS